MIKWLYAADAGLILAVILVLFFRRGLGIPSPVVDVLVKLVDGSLHWCTRRGAGSHIFARGDTTPSNAVGRLFLPFYNVYWMFAVNLRLGDSLESLLAERSDHRLAPRGLAVLAASLSMGTSIFGYVPEVKPYQWVLQSLTQVAWLAYMLSCDPLRRAVIGASREVR